MIENKRIAISGTIGAGKSTVGAKLGGIDGVNYYKEAIDEELLDLFTKQVITKEIASEKPIELLHQLRFLNETIIRDIKSDYYKSYIDIFDRAIFEHIHVFAKKTLKPRDWALYNGLQELILANMGWKKYDLNIILQDDIENIYQKVSGRKRDMEQLTHEYKNYLVELNDIYNSDEFVELARQYSKEVHVLDVRGLSADEVFEVVKDLVLNKE